MGATAAAAISFKAGVGCTYCNLSGYRGRVAVYEILELDRALADAIRRNDSLGFSQAARLRRGYVPLTQAALQLAGEGVTSLAEAISVTSGLDEQEEVVEPLLDDALAAELRSQSSSA